MRDLLSTLVARDHPVDRESWHSFLDRVTAQRLQAGEGAAVLASLSTAMPDEHTLGALFDCLDERRPAPSTQLPAAVNIVGTGGGRQTFNVSTMAAIVAAAMGVRVVKTGSRAYSSRHGSIDLLDRLGIRPTRSYEETAERLHRFGIAFAGMFVYPTEIAMLARQIVPLSLRTVGRFVNSIGPFLAAVPVAAQLTGVVGPALLHRLRFLADRDRDKRVWLCHNAVRADELISFTDNMIHDNGGAGDFVLPVGALCPGDGALADLRPADDDPVEQFLDIIAGQAQPAAVRTVCLNAAALAVLSGTFGEWTTAFHAAERAVRTGAAADLVNRMRTVLVGARG
jgi:anthranilate phosphoribosyltransferase